LDLATFLRQQAAFSPPTPLETYTSQDENHGDCEIIRRQTYRRKAGIPDIAVQWLLTDGFPQSWFYDPVVNDTIAK
jgi:hypothetical protein